ncbi:MAG: hypothetical protein AAF591_19080 [Verrucomicrobiota bacterium]
MRVLHHIARGIYLLFFVLAIGGALKLLAFAPKPTNNAPHASATPGAIPPDSITAASESLFLFISAPAAPQSALFIQNPNDHLKSLEAFILHRTPQNVQVRYSRSDQSPSPHTHSHVHWFELEFEQDKRRFDVAIYPSKDGYKLSWPEFLEAYTASDPDLAGSFPQLPLAPIPGVN